MILRFNFWISEYFAARAGEEPAERSVAPEARALVSDGVDRSLLRHDQCFIERLWRVPPNGDARMWLKGFPKELQVRF